jgi:hypothetical protein
MRATRILCLLLAVTAASPALADEPYRGLWSESAKICRTDTDGVQRMEINRNGFYWYESRCRGPVTPAGPNAWTAKLQCEGEGERWARTTRLVLASPDRLILESPPVGQAKRQTYVRCRALERGVSFD